MASTAMYGALALTLLVLGVGADDADDALAADDFAVFADAFDGGANFHGFTSMKTADGIGGFVRVAMDQ